MFRQKMQKAKIFLTGLEISIVLIIISLILVSGTHRTVYHKLTSPVMIEKSMEEVKEFGSLAKSEIEVVKETATVWNKFKKVYNYLDDIIGFLTGVTGLYNLIQTWRKKKTVTPTT